MRVVFIVHGNENIGLGHVMRSISLAEAFRERGHNVSFFSRFRQGIDLIISRGFEIEKCYEQKDENTSRGFFYGGKKEQEAEVKDVLDNLSGQADVIIVDSYNVSQEYFLSIKRKAGYLIYIDDLNKFEYPVDMLLNGTASATDMGYENQQSAKLLIGLKYNLIRKEFRNMSKKIVKESIMDILITTGNSDPFHMTEQILRYLLKQIDGWTCNYHIIIGGGFEKSICNEADLADRINIFWYDKPSNMADLMLKSDVAITAGGTTLYELAACGTPAVAFAYAENQQPQLAALQRMGLVRYIGYYDNLQYAELKKYLEHLGKQADYRRKLSEQLQVLVDGKGVYRVVKEVEQCVKK